MVGKVVALLARVVLPATAAWAALALYIDAPLSSAPKIAAAAALSAGGAAVLIRGLRRRALDGLLLASVVAVAIWWLRLPPSNQRDWQPDVALLPWAEIQEHRITLHNIRDNQYRSESDYTVRYYDRSFDLAALRSVDLFLVYWGSPLIAHTMLSFGFEDGGQVCFSIETRKERGESYSAFKGFFRQYELTYVVGDERDLVRLRTHLRHEQVYLYRLKTPPEMARGVFADYARFLNHLKDHPEWYNALTTNCTTSIRGHTLPYNPGARFDYRMLVNGLLDEMLYERAVVDVGQPFEQLKARSLINARAQAAPDGPEFSRWIRAGLPGIPGEGP
jgi:hypothetical protein